MSNTNTNIPAVKAIMATYLAPHRRSYQLLVNAAATVNPVTVTVASDTDTVTAVVPLYRKSILECVDYWYRLLLLLKARLNESIKWCIQLTKWQQSATELLSSLFSGSSSASSGHTDTHIKKLLKVKIDKNISVLLF